MFTTILEIFIKSVLKHARASLIMHVFGKWPAYNSTYNILHKTHISKKINSSPSA